MPSRLLRRRGYTKVKILTGTIATALTVEFSWEDPFPTVDSYEVITDVYIPAAVNLVAKSNCIAKTTTSCTVRVTAIGLALPLNITNSNVRVIADIKMIDPN